MIGQLGPITDFQERRQLHHGLETHIFLLSSRAAHQVRSQFHDSDGTHQVRQNSWFINSQKDPVTRSICFLAKIPGRRYVGTL